MAANPDSQLTYLGAWPHQVIVFDAAKEKIVDRIELKTDVPRSLVLSPDHKKLYVSTLNDNAIVTIDLATNKVIDSFSLNTPGKNYRLSGLTTDPAGHFLVRCRRYHHQTDGPLRRRSPEVRSYRSELRRRSFAGAIFRKTTCSLATASP